MTAFDQLLALTANASLTLSMLGARVAVCPTLGGRVFAEVGGVLAHRLDLDNVAHPDRPFNNFGGGNLWPAPEGGPFGFNYRGDDWYVQPAINAQPFTVSTADADHIGVENTVNLVNRAGVLVETRITREVRLAPLPSWLADYPLRAAVAYQTLDVFTVLNEVSADSALLAAWTLDQFTATPDTLAFCRVAASESAINFDFYAHPGERIRYYPHGFTYRTDGQCRGQIGIPVAANAACLGAVDPVRGLLCLRENRNAGQGQYFNIADNDQQVGPYAAADAYSIFNSDPEMLAFELETIGGATITDGLLRGSTLCSATTFAVMEDAAALNHFLQTTLGV